ncbi:MAG: DUF4416 family protein [Verrucomicrobia bacterium]|nr:DUF4416 family protein [Verrucomicrobiota bacterium]
MPDAVLVCGLIATGEAAADSATLLLVASCGPILLASSRVPFAWTDYYAAEMGDGLLRQFLAFERPFYPGRLGETKRATCVMEREHARDGRRTFNLDPGYMTFSTLVVASTKEASYRVYLGAGIYAQPMLVYRERRFHPFEWTYPDYADSTHTGYFAAVRRLARDRGILTPR